MSEFDAGLGTTQDMWRALSSALDTEQLPVSLNDAIYQLCAGTATVQYKDIPQGDLEARYRAYCRKNHRRMR